LKIRRPAQFEINEQTREAGRMSDRSPAADSPDQRPLFGAARYGCGWPNWDR